MSKAREIEREMEYEPGLRWLCGLQTINHHTLSDFVSEGGEELKELFAQLLAVLEGEGLISLERVMHDGTRVRAQASSSSFRREKSLRARLAQARELVEQMEREGPGDEEPRRVAARRRAAREREVRVGRALREVQKLGAESRKKEGEKEQVRASTSDPEARVMKQSDGGFRPSYNVQISTEAQNRIIVGLDVTQAGNDYAQLQPAVEEIKANLGERPKQVVVDGGYSSVDNVVAMAGQQVDLIGSLGDGESRSAAALKRLGIKPEYGPKQFEPLEGGAALRCPAGKKLDYIGGYKNHSWVYGQYRARGSDCRGCPHQPHCCPRRPERGRVVSIRREPPEWSAFREKMATEEARHIYRQRAGVAETPHAWIKESFGLRQFRLRGLLKVRSEALLYGLAYNVMQWIRLRWRPALAAGG